MIAPRGTAFALVLAAVAAGPAPPEGGRQSGAERGSTSDRLSEGREAERRGDLEAALGAYEEAAALARAAGEAETEAEAAVSGARVLRLRVGPEAVDQAPLLQAARLAEDAVRLARGARKEDARNELGLIYLRLRRYPDAVEAFSQVDLSAFDPLARDNVLYNRARALDLNGDRFQALGLYRDILSRRPEFTLAARRAFDLAGKLPPPDAVDGFLRIARLLIDRGEIPVALAAVRERLAPPAREPRSRGDVRPSPPPGGPRPPGDAIEEKQKYLTAYLFYLSRKPIEPLTFTEEDQDWHYLEDLRLGYVRWSSDLEEEGLRQKVADLSQAIEQVGLAFTKDVEPLFDEASVTRTFPRWSEHPWQRQSLSELLTGIGDDFVRLPREATPLKIRKGLARYAAAWTLDRQNWRAARSIAEVLAGYPRQVDPERQLVDQFLRGLLGESTGGYAVAPRTPEDWRNARFVHSFLSERFAEDRIWGTGGDPHGVVAQLRFAIEAEEQASGSSPELNAMLAQALDQRRRGAGRDAAARHADRLDAWDHWMEAAEEFLDLGAVETAQDALEAANRLGPISEPDRRRRRDQLRRALQEKGPRGSATPAQPLPTPKFPSKQTAAPGDGVPEGDGPRG